MDSRQIAHQEPPCGAAARPADATGGTPGICFGRAPCPRSRGSAEGIDSERTRRSGQASNRGMRQRTPRIHRAGLFRGTPFGRSIIFIKILHFWNSNRVLCSWFRGVVAEIVRGFSIPARCRWLDRRSSARPHRGLVHCLDWCLAGAAAWTPCSANSAPCHAASRTGMPGLPARHRGPAGKIEVRQYYPA